MKRDFLEGLNLEADVIDKIMAENGKDIEREKAKFKDYDETKADVEKYKAESERIQQEAAVKIAEMERSAQVKEFLSGKKFVNDLTRDALAAQLSKQLAGDEAKGKSIDDLFSALTKDKTNIFVDESKPSPPVIGGMAGSVSTKDDARAKVRAVMGLPPEKTAQ